MDIELIKRMMDACYQGKRIRDMLPPLPEGIGSSYIQYLDTIQKLNRQGIQVKVSDVSNSLTIPRPGVTRTLKDMEAKGLIQKLASTEDGRVTYLTITESGKQLLDKYGDEGKDPNPIAKGMSHMKTGMKLGMDDSDETIADLMTDGCNMGVKSLSQYLNQYQAADETSKDITKRLIALEERLAVDIRGFL